MKLDRTTYEAWLLDRMEGTLSPAQLRELDDFLRANPDLAAEVPHGDPPMLRAEDPGFDDKASLKRTLPPQGLPTPTTLPDFLVALGEGDLDPQQQRALAEYLDQHPEARNDARLMALARLTPPPEPMPTRETLRRTFPPTGAVDRHRLTDFLIAELEGTLDAGGRAALQAFLAAHPEAERERRLVAATRLRPEAVRFPARDALYRGRGRVLPLFHRPAFYRYAAAAALLLGLGLWALLDRPDPDRAGLAELREAPAAPQRPEQRAPAPTGGSAQRPAALPGGPQDPPQRSATTHGDHRTNERTLRDPAGTTEDARERTLLAHMEPLRHHPIGTRAQNPIPVDPAPLAASVPTPDEFLAVATAAAPPTLGGLIAQRLRNKVLDQPGADARPLDEGDALAVVDKGLRRIGGEAAGLAVQRRGRRITRFDLRLGAGLAVSANRGH